MYFNRSVILQERKVYNMESSLTLQPEVGPSLPSNRRHSFLFLSSPVPTTQYSQDLYNAINASHHPICHIHTGLMHSPVLIILLTRSHYISCPSLLMLIILTNSIAYGTLRFNAAFTRVLQ